MGVGTFLVHYFPIMVWISEYFHCCGTCTQHDLGRKYWIPSVFKSSVWSFLTNLGSWADLSSKLAWVSAFLPVSCYRAWYQLLVCTFDFNWLWYKSFWLPQKVWEILLHWNPVVVFSGTLTLGGNRNTLPVSNTCTKMGTPTTSSPGTAPQLCCVTSPTAAKP